jgi:hypothetical protein
VEADEDSVLGPEHRVRSDDLGPVSDIGRAPEPVWDRLPAFRETLATLCAELSDAGVGIILMTTVLVGDDLRSPLNVALRAYSRAVSEVANASGLPLVDVNRAFRDVLDRAITYKQRVSLTNSQGEPNAQGQALIARTMLATLGLLPQTGHRPAR